MLQTSEVVWSDTETQCAHGLLQKAYEREVSNLLMDVQRQATTLTQAEDLWHLHDFLSAKRHEIDGKYDNRQTVIIFVFAQLLREGLVSMEELDFLSGDKRAKVKVLAYM